MNLEQRRREVRKCTKIRRIYKREKIKQNNILTKLEINSLSKIFKNLKELLDLITSKISSDGGDFLRIIEIALFQFSLVFSVNWKNNNRKTKRGRKIEWLLQVQVITCMENVVQGWQVFVFCVLFVCPFISPANSGHHSTGIIILKKSHVII